MDHELEPPTDMIVLDGKFHWAFGADRPFLYGPDWFCFAAFEGHDVTGRRRERFADALYYLNENAVGHSDNEWHEPVEYVLGAANSYISATT